jgi:flagellin-like protein
MQLKQLFTDDDAVSPVIGVILMVAITVILAAVIGAFVLDIGGSQESAPQVQWDWTDDSSNSKVVIEHGGGDTVNNPGQIEVAGDVDTDGVSIDQLDNAPTGDTWTAGDSADIMQSGGTNVNLNGGSGTGTVSLVWQSSDGSQSNTISEHDYDIS